MKALYKENGPFKYSVYEWYSLGLDKDNLKEMTDTQKYCGDTRKDSKVKEGKGVFLTPEGNLYEGFFKHGRQYGKGRILYSANALYQGDWKNGAPHGFGIYID